MELSAEKKEILIVCGSVFLMAEAREALGFDEPRDSAYIAEVAGAGVRHGQENFGNSTIKVLVN
jgi:dihydrofolate synthase/folylpolyglutamate synthase